MVQPVLRLADARRQVRIHQSQHPRSLQLVQCHAPGVVFAATGIVKGHGKGLVLQCGHKVGRRQTPVRTRHHHCPDVRGRDQCDRVQ